MRKLSVLFCVIAFAGGVRASWYWPFGSDEGGEEPKRISELMEKASELIDEASDFASDGKIDESVETYRKALGELDRIERENPDRVKSSEFATLRNKRAYVNAAIDSMLLSQVKQNAKAVAVSDTTDLEKKLAEERWADHMKKALEAVTRKDMAAADAEFKEALGCYTNSFARASVLIFVATGGFLSGDFKRTDLALRKAESYLLGYTDKDPLIRQSLNDSLLDIRGVLADYREIVATSRVVRVKAAAGKSCISNLVFIGRLLPQYDFDEAKSLYAAATNLQEKAGSEADSPESWRSFDVAANDFLKLSPITERVWRRLAGVEFQVLKERVSQNIARAEELKNKDGNDEKSDMAFTNHVVAALAALSRFESDHPECGQSSEFTALRTECGRMLPKKSGETLKKTDGPKSRERVKPTRKTDQGLKVSSPSAAKPVTKREQAIVDIANGDYAAAELVIKEMLAEKPNGAMALNLKAAMEMKQGKLDVAEDTLDQAIMSNPRNYAAYYNLAMLRLQKDAGGKDSARRYYETGRAMGGPENAELEELLK